MITFEINTYSHCLVPIKMIEQCLRTAAAHDKKIAGHVEVTLLEEKEMRALNLNARGINKVTDVISFSWQETSDFPFVIPEKNKKIALLGQVYLCYPYIVRQADRFGVSSYNEFIRMLIHGLLHLAGYDHHKKKDAERMFSQQEKLVEFCQKVVGEKK